MPHEWERLIDWAMYGTTEHRTAQGNCPHLIACAVDDRRRRAVAFYLATTTRYGDEVGALICIAQLNGPCVLPPREPEQQTVT
jgi:hypothetical protein